MTRKSWVYVDGVAIPKDEYQAPTVDGAVIVGDLAGFRSPVDGSWVEGRAALREHNKRNDVVNTADLAGLPPRLAVAPQQSNRAAIRQTLINEFNKRGM